MKVRISYTTRAVTPLDTPAVFQHSHNIDTIEVQIDRRVSGEIYKLNIKDASGVSNLSKFLTYAGTANGLHYYRTKLSHDNTAYEGDITMNFQILVPVTVDGVTKINVRWTSEAFYQTISAAPLDDSADIDSEETSVIEEIYAAIALKQNITHKGFYKASELGISGTKTTLQYIDAVLLALTDANGDFVFDGIANIVNDSATLSDAQTTQTILALSTDDSTGSNIAFGQIISMNTTPTTAHWYGIYYNGTFSGWIQSADTEYVDLADATKANLDGGNSFNGNQAFNGTVSMEGEKIVNLAGGEANDDAVNKSQLDTKAGSADNNVFTGQNEFRQNTYVLPTSNPGSIMIKFVPATATIEIYIHGILFSSFNQWGVYLNPDYVTSVQSGNHVPTKTMVDGYISSHNASGSAHSDIRNLIAALQGAYVYRGKINSTTAQIEANKGLLTSWISTYFSGRLPIVGDVLLDLSGNEWYYGSGSETIDSNWYNMGQAIIGLATALSDGLLSKEDYSKLLALYTKAQMDALFATKSELDNAKSMYGWVKTNIGTYGNASTLALSALADYDFIYFQYFNDDMGDMHATQQFRRDLITNGVYVYFWGQDNTQPFAYFNVGATNITFNSIIGTNYCFVTGVKMQLFDATTVATDFDGTNYLDAETTVDDSLIALDTGLANLESKVDIIGLDYKEYGVREVVGQTSAVLERATRHFGEIKLGSATGLVANVALDDAIVTNSFDSISIFNRTRETIIESADVSNVFVKVPKYYVKEEWVTDGEVDYHYWWMCAKKLDGYRLPLPFMRSDQSEREFAYVGAYESSLDVNTKLRSLSDQFPRVSYSRASFRTAARKLDTNDANSKYQITDLAEYVDLVQIPMMIEFATKNMQSILNGFTSGQYSGTHLSLLAEIGVNRVVLTNAQAALYRVGQTIDIGTSLGGRQTAQDRLILSITADTPSVGQSQIVFDGAAVTTTTSQIVYNVAWKTGVTNLVVSSSGFLSANDGKYPFVWRGMENPYGNIWKNIDGVKISNNRGWVCTDSRKYDDIASVAGDYAYPYQSLNFLNAIVNGYAKELGFDSRFPFARLTTDATGGSATFYSDYYYQDAGDRTAFAGGFWGCGVTAGPFSWYLNYSLGYSSLIIGARLSYRP